MQRTTLEGSPHVAEYRYEGKVDATRRIDLRVDLGPRADRGAAQQALQAVRLAPPLPRCGRERAMR